MSIRRGLVSSHNGNYIDTGDQHTIGRNLFWIVLFFVISPAQCAEEDDLEMAPEHFALFSRLLTLYGTEQVLNVLIRLRAASLELLATPQARTAANRRTAGLRPPSPVPLAPSFAVPAFRLGEAWTAWIQLIRRTAAQQQLRLVAAESTDVH